MEFSIFIPLMVAAIQSAGQVLSSFTSKAKEAASKFIFDKEFFEDTIVKSSEQLAKLIDVAFLDLKQEMIELHIAQAVEDLQARISSLGHVLSLAKTSEITPELTNQLIRNEIVPLQTSLSKAETRLSKHEREDMRLFCHVVGKKTLIACYLYIGKSVPSLQKDLEDSIYVFQKRLLNSIAQSNREIPWNKIPYLLTTDGVSELVELYNSTLKDDKKISPTESVSIASKDPNESLKSSSTVKKKS